MSFIHYSISLQSKTYSTYNERTLIIEKLIHDTQVTYKANMPLVFLGSEGITKGALVSDLAHVPLVWRLLTPPQLKQRRPLSEQVYSIAICYLKKIYQ